MVGCGEAERGPRMLREGYRACSQELGREACKVVSREQPGLSGIAGRQPGESRCLGAPCSGTPGLPHAGSL